MRILGYPAEKISILTTYNGQAQLIRDVFQRRCDTNPLIGMPAKVGGKGEKKTENELKIVKNPNSDDFSGKNSVWSTEIGYVMKIQVFCNFS